MSRDEEKKSSFGPSALATPANAVTLARILATPVLVALILSRPPSWWTVAVGLTVAGSDGVDGWVARRQGTTRSGAFLDPLADKALVLGALIALVVKGYEWWLPVALIGAREIGMSLYRSFEGRRGVSIPARFSAKMKTLLQEIAIGCCIIPTLAPKHTPQVVAIWIAVAITLYSGGQYLIDGRRLQKKSAQEREAAAPCE